MIIVRQSVITSLILFALTVNSVFAYEGSSLSQSQSSQSQLSESALTQALLDQIQLLFQQIAALQKQLDAVGAGSDSMGTPPFDSTRGKLILGFNRDLYLGLKGDAEVRRLQEFLIEKGYLASGFNTGNYFSLTSEAIRRYQVDQGIITTGYFGPLTRARINAELRSAAVLKDSERPKIIETREAIAVMVPVAATSAEEKFIIQEDDLGHKILPQPQYDLANIEMAIQNTISHERAIAGLSLLAWNDGVAEVSRKHSQDQANDNIVTTDIDKSCSYPIIRHEGLSFGFTLGERLVNSSIRYRIAGENIIIFPLSQNNIYRYRRDEGSVDCPKISALIIPDGASQEEKIQLIKAAVRERGEVNESLKDVDWVNREWLTADEIVKQAVDGWLGSPGHRANIFESNFTGGGVGAALINDYLIITHVFIGN